MCHAVRFATTRQDGTAVFFTAGNYANLAFNNHQIDIDGDSVGIYYINADGDDILISDGDVMEDEVLT